MPILVCRKCRSVGNIDENKIATHGKKKTVIVDCPYCGNYWYFTVPRSMSFEQIINQCQNQLPVATAPTEEKRETLISLAFKEALKKKGKQ